MTHAPAAAPWTDAPFAALAERIAALDGGVLVAFSGGVDSAVLLKACVDLLGPARVLAVTADSPSIPEHDRRDAERVAALVGARRLVVPTRELEDDRYRRNDRDRCYFCKHTLFDTLAPIAREQGLAHVAFGANKDDEGDFRPGHRAAAEHSVRAPLLEAGLTKDDVRALARALGLPVWDKPASACLASRVPYGTAIDPEVLGRIDRAEQRVRALGFPQCRVRHHGEVARLELARDDLARAVDAADALVTALREVGYLHVALDLAGYESGSLNRALADR